MTVLARLAAAFVEPPPVDAWSPPVAPAAAAAAAGAVAVLCAARDAGVAGGSAALNLLRELDAPVAIVADWRAERIRHLPVASPAAGRLARLLCEHGLRAIATGRLVRVALADEEHEAAREAAWLLEEAMAPTVLVVAGARAAAMDSVVMRHREALVARRADDADGFAALAAAELSVGGVLTAELDVRASPLSAALAAAGLRPLRGS